MIILTLTTKVEGPQDALPETVGGNGADVDPPDEKERNEDCGQERDPDDDHVGNVKLIGVVRIFQNDLLDDPGHGEKYFTYHSVIFQNGGINSLEDVEWQKTDKMEDDDEQEELLRSPLLVQIDGIGKSYPLFISGTSIALCHSS